MILIITINPFEIKNGTEILIISNENKKAKFLLLYFYI